MCHRPFTAAALALALAFALGDAHAQPNVSGDRMPLPDQGVIAEVVADEAMIRLEGGQEVRLSTHARYRLDGETLRGYRGLKALQPGDLVRLHPEGRRERSGRERLGELERLTR